MYTALKHLHLTLALISILGFLFRAQLSLRAHPMLQKKWLKITPHIVDTLLLLAGLSLAFHLGVNPAEQHWLAAKLIALVAYIILGAQVIKARGSRGRQVVCLVLAVASFMYMAMVAVTKSPVLS